LRIAFHEEDENSQRLVPKGVSVFDLIMPWKTEVQHDNTPDLVSDGLAKVIACPTKQPIYYQDLSKYASDVTAILINPPWENAVTTVFNSSKQKNITIADFTKLVIPTSVMKDGLVFIWVEKEVICEVMRHFKAQDFDYVENVCYVMLDQN